MRLCRAGLQVVVDQAQTQLLAIRADLDRLRSGRANVGRDGGSAAGVHLPHHPKRAAAVPAAAHRSPGGRALQPQQPWRTIEVGSSPAVAAQPSLPPMLGGVGGVRRPSPPSASWQGTHFQHCHRRPAAQTGLMHGEQAPVPADPTGPRRRIARTAAAWDSIPINPARCSLRCRAPCTQSPERTSPSPRRTHRPSLTVPLAPRIGNPEALALFKQDLQRRIDLSDAMGVGGGGGDGLP